jgi:hypothetical protein
MFYVVFVFVKSSSPKNAFNKKKQENTNERYPTDAMPLKKDVKQMQKNVENNK